ncbi:MAG: hypothetical protein GEV05_02525 [Betaproteobacteria bacterium]|nr:hypothetical protein [Betaproteobacteria bacterium]
MKASRLDNKVLVPGGETVNLALDEMLKRLEFLEQRVERLEAAAGMGRAAAAASNADDFTATGAPQQAHSVASAEPIEQQGEAPAHRGSVVEQRGETSTHRGSTAEQQGERSTHRGSTADAPVTERLDRVPGRDAGADPFPDLSLLDEKVEPKKGPAEHLRVRAALEDYPRISTRIEQLWGTPDCEAYLNSLVIDTRGNRQGFPPAMMEELLYLGRLARALVILRVSGDLWDTFDQVGDRR